MRKSTLVAGLQKSPHSPHTRTYHKTITVIHIPEPSCPSKRSNNTLILKHSHEMFLQLIQKTTFPAFSVGRGTHGSDEGLGAAGLEENCLQGVQLVRQAQDRSGGRDGGWSSRCHNTPARREGGLTEAPCVFTFKLILALLKTSCVLDNWLTMKCSMLSLVLLELFTFSIASFRAWSRSESFRRRETTSSLRDWSCLGSSESGRAALQNIRMRESASSRICRKVFVSDSSFLTDPVSEGCWRKNSCELLRE